MSDPAGKRMDVEARRQQIVDAASACARRSGFHGASMAEIAHAAGMSVGQIYRYFENKEAIIAAIVARDMAEMRDRYTEIRDGDLPVLEAILTKCSTAIDELYEAESAALTLEVVAEAARNPNVGAILQSADAEERLMQQELLREVMPPGCDEAEQIARGEVISMLFEGMTMRGVNNPNGDRAAISRVLRSTLRHLLSEPCDDRTS
ncbi:MAG: TetR/AcrR family transcriptional regulator [Alphaproteobacteria bacterium]|nr:TetR/AcrR family transcriptional regulator [Alphaproteobacteria bacterium]MBU1517158.1 TetR/AcrR family transcriptional regulator [Alphaproteobacteria bacterium]MBU2096509.1 TetR/AcrR family transcriptional regulator [Alphaproteobacteria bacterium]MBU2151661.1 TetR/AcrR family transcriptional regulator [Alphaproteobacteria bacterium]MBU2305461.1 TetR/AcrR family transcriptional regulator [Alphaproteobacteria bacterium]